MARSEAEVQKDLGNARKAAGDLAGAVECYRRALAADPAHLASLYNLGLALRELGELAEAEACFRRLLAADAGDADALFHLGTLLQGSMRLPEAMDAFRRGLAAAPGNPYLWMALGEAGVARFTDDSLREAAQAYGKALELQPGLAHAHAGLGQVHRLEGRHELALACFEKALALAPGDAEYRAELLWERQSVCSWAGLEDLSAAHRRDAVAQPMPPFRLLAIDATPEEQLACATRYSQSIEEGVAGERARAAFRREARPPGRLRIGYLSAEFHEHATAWLMAELFELHDRARFEVSAYSYGPDDGSAMRSRLAGAFEHFIDVRALSDAAAARRIHADGIDILVDLKGYTFRARPGIAALRPAPLQVSHIGYPGTMGAAFIDYLVADAFVAPPAEARNYREALALMPGSYQVNDRHRPVGPAPARAALGLPARGFVYCCFNQSYKILPAMFAAWMRLLHAVPGSVLWLLEWNRQARDNLCREAAAQGIEPARLVFAPLQPLAAHLGRLPAADLFLDTFPCNAHTTCSDALWAGLPVLTLAGRTFASRVAGSLLHAVGLPELVTASLADYEALALRLATGPSELAALRARLGAHRQDAPLFDAAAYARGLEALFDGMWRRYAAGLPPATLDSGRPGPGWTPP